jgi:hypothetical protein
MVYHLLYVMPPTVILLKKKRAKMRLLLADHLVIMSDLVLVQVLNQAQFIQAPFRPQSIIWNGMISRQAVLAMLMTKDSDGTAYTQEQAQCVLNNLIKKYNYNDFYNYNNAADKDFLNMSVAIATQCLANQNYDGHYNRTTHLTVMDLTVMDLEEEIIAEILKVTLCQLELLSEL